MMAAPKRSRLGVTLVELIVALTILVSLLVAVAEALTATFEQTSMQYTDDTLALQARRASDLISKDLSLSGWHFISQTAGAYTTTDHDVDRAMIYYPYVIQQAPSGEAPGTTLGRGLPDTTPSHGDINIDEDLTHWQRGADLVQLYDITAPEEDSFGGARTLPPALGEVADFSNNYHDDGSTDADMRSRYYDSYFARSQELIFLKAQTADTWDENPFEQDLPILDFDNGTDADWNADNRHGTLGVEPFGNWSSNNVQAPGAWVANLAGGDVFSVETRWETTSAAPQVYDVTTDQRIMQSELREYGYVVIPSTYTFGRLCRVFSADMTTYPDNGRGTDPGQWISRAGDRAVVIDEILAEDVVRVVFDTLRSDGTGALSLNEVRMRLYMARASVKQPDLILFRQFDFIFTMRTRNNGDANTEDETTLGATGIDFLF